METKDVRVQGGGFSSPVEDKAVRGPKELRRGPKVTNDDRSSDTDDNDSVEPTKE